MLPDTGIKPEDLVFVSGIGCAARLPYYMNTYGIHSIHGRAPAVATGVALARPDLHVWVIGGDGDMLSIGGNHLIHALAPQREHEDPHVQQPDLRPHQGSVLADERDGQGHEVDAVRFARPPVQPDLGRARRGGDLRRPHPRHGPQAHDRGVHAGATSTAGAAFVEVYQNCNVFNDGAFDTILNKDARPDMLINLRHGEPIRFGTDREMGVVMNEHGEAQIVARRRRRRASGSSCTTSTGHDPSLAFALSRLAEHPETPTPVGVFRAVDRPSYEVEMQHQLVAAAERQWPRRPRQACCAPPRPGP